MNLLETLVLGAYIYTTAIGSILYRIIMRFHRNHMKHLENRIERVERRLNCEWDKENPE